MLRRYLSLLLLISFFYGPAWSEDLRAGKPALQAVAPEVSQASTASTSAQTSPANSSTKTDDTPAPLGKSLASFVTGFAVGTPVSCVRLGLEDAVEVTDVTPLIGQSGITPLIWGERAIIYPFCAAIGVLEGPFYAWHKSRDLARHKPFSKESMCLGPIENYEVRCQM